MIENVNIFALYLNTFTLKKDQTEGKSNPNVHRVLKCDVTNTEFLKLWDLLVYSERA